MSADKYPERHKRDLLLSDRISQGRVKNIIKDIFEINFDDDEKEEIYKDWERKPIQLFINSYGGSVYDGLALIDVIAFTHPILYYHKVKRIQVLRK